MLLMKILKLLLPMIMKRKKKKTSENISPQHCTISIFALIICKYYNFQVFWIRLNSRFIMYISNIALFAILILFSISHNSSNYLSLAVSYPNFGKMCHSRRHIETKLKQVLCR